MARNTKQAAPVTPACTNTTAAKKADDAVLSANGAVATAAAPEANGQSEAAPVTEGSTSPDGGAGTEAAASEANGQSDATPAPEGRSPADGSDGSDHPPLWTAPRVSVRAARDGHRRAGRRWTREATTVSLAEFTDEQIEQLLTDPVLSVVEAADDQE